MKIDKAVVNYSIFVDTLRTEKSMINMGINNLDHLIALCFINDQTDGKGSDEVRDKYIRSLNL